uniref:Uncharacterized protein n=1 Tax=Cannabis sativa TaxID=3483 RepID=A0A803PDF0_CANSA
MVGLRKNSKEESANELGRRFITRLPRPQVEPHATEQVQSPTPRGNSANLDFWAFFCPALVLIGNPMGFGMTLGLASEDFLSVPARLILQAVSRMEQLQMVPSHSERSHVFLVHCQVLWQNQAAAFSTHWKTACEHQKAESYTKWDHNSFRVPAFHGPRGKSLSDPTLGKKLLGCSGLVDLEKPEISIGHSTDFGRVLESEIVLESVMHADTDHGVICIVGSSSDTPWWQTSRLQGILLATIERGKRMKAGGCRYLLQLK